MNLRQFMALGILLLASLASAAEDRTSDTDRKLYVVSYEPGIQPVAINRMHSWVIHVATAEGNPVDNAAVTVVGGMPDHNHGLPTAPRSTQYLDDGNYLVEGIKFHMNGRWEVTVTIDVDGVRDAVTFVLQL